MATENNISVPKHPTKDTTNSEETNIITVAYMNTRGQTGLDIAKQVQIENFLKVYKVDNVDKSTIN